MPDVSTILTTLHSELPQGNEEIDAVFNNLNLYYEQKLWHQLTTALKTLYASEWSLPIRATLYDEFVSLAIDKLNQLDVVHFLSHSININTDQIESLTRLNKLKHTFSEIDNNKQRNDGLQNHANGILLIDLIIAQVHLIAAAADADAAAASSSNINSAKDILNEFEANFITNYNIDALPLKVLNFFYKVNSLYFELKDDYNAFYYNSLLYLSTRNTEKNKETDSNNNDDTKLAYDLCIAALLGDQIFNFGELLQHPLIKDITQDQKITNENTNFNYILALLNSLSMGDFNKFDALINNKQLIQNIKPLSNNEPFLRQKICIMTLIESVSTKNIRILSFNDVATATHLNINDVEHLVMKAISLRLLKGSIDQVHQIITITWVQPRIINFDQIEKMNTRLIAWQLQVNKLAEKMQRQGKSIWV